MNLPTGPLVLYIQARLGTLEQLVQGLGWAHLGLRILAKQKLSIVRELWIKIELQHARTTHAAAWEELLAQCRGERKLVEFLLLATQNAASLVEAETWALQRFNQLKLEQQALLQALPQIDFQNVASLVQTKTPLEHKSRLT